MTSSMNMDGEVAEPAQQQRQIAEIFTILASLTRDMDSVKQTLEQLVEDGGGVAGHHQPRPNSWTETSDTGLSSEERDGSATLPGLLLSPRMLSPRTSSNRQSPHQNHLTSIWLNIGGARFETNFGVLERLPQTRLGMFNSTKLYATLFAI